MIARPPAKTQPIPFTASSGNDMTSPRAAVPLATTPNWHQATQPAHVTQVAPLVGRPIPKAGQPASARGHASHASHGAAHAPARRAGEPSAKYLGRGNLSVRSSVTGRHYRFEGHGATLNIDSRDQLMLRRIPELLIA
ncbi:MAG: hypothetical protein EOP38_11125 [Rubrivivax sp.]|nr:MAG: hypothetical protein EOP38_11125 [Rubrivivax sp.]